jgi:putative transposase
MKIVVQVRLMPTPEVASALECTLRACNDAANWLSGQAHERGEASRRALQGFAYRDLKGRGLSAQPALHVLRKVADAYSTLKANIRSGNLGKPGSKRRRRAESKPVAFRPDAAQPYDDRCLSWQVDEQTVSIWTTSGRMRGVRFACSGRARELLAGHRKGETDLVHRGGMWFLIATCEVPEADTFEPDGFIGVDVGIANIATASTGYRAAGRGLNRHRKRQLELRRKLQKKGTKSAKRRLRHRRRKEQRYAANVNHIISKKIVTEAERTSRGIALEDLGGIRQRVRLRKPQRVTLHSWAFAQLGRFVEYKARRAGVPLVYVDPAYTSQECAECHHIEKNNRVDQARFICRRCGVVAHADRNASHVIAHRGETVWTAGRESRVPATP